MSDREYGIRSLRCCKRRSVVSNLRGFGQKWSSSRMRIVIIHPAPIVASPYSTFSKHASSSEIAVAAVAGLSLQGHSVTLYTSGYRQKDIPDYLWETSGDVKACLPRILRLALFPIRRRESHGWLVQTIVSVIISIQVVVNCFLTFAFNWLWSVLPTAIQRARGGALANRSTPPSLSSVIDVLITFGETTVPHMFLAPFCAQILHFPLDKDLSQIASETLLGSHLFSLARCTSVIGTTDAETLKWAGRGRKVSTVYAPVIGLPISPLTPTNGCRRSMIDGATSSLSLSSSEMENRCEEVISSPRPYFVALAWYPHFPDLLLAIESFALFLSAHWPAPVTSAAVDDLVCSEEEGCTGSAKVVALPRLVVAGVDMDNYLLVMREINRFKLLEGEDVVVMDSSISRASVCELLGKSIGLIHVPNETNQVRIPCAAMLAGIPVITPVSFSIAEPVRHESTGLVVRTRSAPLIADAIDILFMLYVNRQQEWVRMGKRARQRVVTEQSIEMFGSKLDDIILESSSIGKGIAAPTSTPPQLELAAAEEIRKESVTAGPPGMARSRISVQRGMAEMSSLITEALD